MKRLIESANEDLKNLVNQKKTLADYLVNNCVSTGDGKNAATACNDLREIVARIEILLRVKYVVSTVMNELANPGESVPEVAGLSEVPPVEEDGTEAADA